MVCLGTYQDRVIYMIIYAAIHLGAWLVIEPVLEGKTCKALPSATAFLIIYGILSILCLPIELYNNWKRIGKDLDPQMDVHVIPGEGELYPSHKTLAILYSALGLTTLFIGVCWGFPMWIVQTVRGGSGSNCSAGIYTGVGFAAWIAVGITVYIALVFGGMPDFCHIVTPAHANDLEEPLSPKEPEQATVTPRKAN